MPSDADWRPLPTDPGTLVGWTLRAALEQTPQLLVSTLLILLFIGLAVLFCGLGVPPDLSGEWSWPNLSWHKAPARLGSLPPIPAKDAWFPIRVQFQRHGVPT